jgi:hypothetical protein
MKRKYWVIGGVLLLVAGGLVYFLRHQPSSPPPPPSGMPQLSQDQLQKGLQEMVVRKTEKRSLQTQLAVYEKLLIQLPDNAELRRRAEELRRQISELE